ncbi:MAG: hypothetical protein ABR953_12760 [Candidatus Acidiferrales bacterium]|jgi:hypothetical protein
MSPLAGTGFEGIRMRHRLTVIRDTIVVLGLQVVFRATLILRSWNY